MNILLTTKKIIWSILLFGLATNVLILADIQFLYLRAIVSFIFLSIVPGFMTMLIFKLRKLFDWEAFILCIGLSLSYLILGGLFINTVLPFFNIQMPLSLPPVLVSLNVTVVIMSIFAFMLNKDLSINLSLKKPNYKNFLFNLIPFSFPILSVMGATSLNNGGSNMFVILMLTFIALMIPVVLYLGNKVKFNYGLIIYLISLSSIFMISFRGVFLFGSDIQTEYLVYNLANAVSHWQPNSLPGDLYNLCLSITILPSIISSITNLQGVIIFKLILPLFFSLVPVGVYVFAKNYFDEIKSFVAALFFLSFSSYYNIFPTHERQGISTLFFVTMVFLLISNKFTNKSKHILVMLFGIAMILSHYSTAFLALLLLSLIYLVMFIIKYFISKRINFFRRKLSFEPKLSILVIVLLWTVFFSWYTQPNGSTKNDFVSYLSITAQNLKYSFSDHMKADRGTIIQQLNIFYKPQPQKILDETYASLTNTEDGTNNNLANYKVTYIPSSVNKIIIDPKIATDIIHFGEIVKRIGLFLMLIGIGYLVFVSIKKKETSLVFVSSVVICFAITISSLIIPFISIGYDIVRIYQQCLVFLAIPAVIGIYFLLQKIKNYKLLLLSLFFSLHFLIFTGYIYELVGGTIPSIQFSNAGYDYDLNYVHMEEIAGITWFSNNNTEPKVYIDSANHKKLKLVNKDIQLVYSDLMLPSQIGRDDYVYLGFTNATEGKGIAWLKSIMIGYSIPTQYLDQNKNLIYNNGGSKVYK